MKLITFFIILGVAGHALAGGLSQCGPLLQTFTPLMQAIEYIVDFVLDKTETTVQEHPFVGNSYIAGFNAFLSIANLTFATGISQLSGVNVDYIMGIFNGTVSSPFISPLDCIETELLSYITYAQNIVQNNVNPLVSQVQQSSVDENTPCAIVMQNYSTYYQLASTRTNDFVSVGTSSSGVFASIGLSNVYAMYTELLSNIFLNMQSVSIAEFLNMDPVLIANYIANQSISVPPPLSCIQGLIDSQINTVNSAANNVQNNIISSSIPPNCNPLYGQFQAFEGVWYHYLNQLRDYAINNSIAHPILTPFFIADLICEVDVMLIFAANATSILTEVDSDIIYNILTGVTVAPFAYPLSCIETDLVYLAGQISILVNNIIPGLQNFAITSTSDISTCNKTHQSLSPYVGTMVTLLNHKATLVANGTIYFMATNFGDLFLESFASVLSCLPNLVGKYVGAALNSNGAPISAFISGIRMTMPNPFNCVNILINIINSLMNQAVVNFITGTNVDLATPNIPRFTG
ncbi:unnamed protein product [Chironomus riparius]|uniref:Secreted protein n=1 Tax=Chironomus riparius TaxID=315576 RepID=A0A9N9RIR3_9DIPT|nr:unnamed protein product [Chironomus riparius]